MTSDERQAFANEAEKALSHKLIEDVVDEALLNHGGDKKSLLYYSLMKVAMYTASVARAQALGIDPDNLRPSREEATVALRARARRMVELGKPTFLIDDHGVTRLD